MTKNKSSYYIVVLDTSAVLNMVDFQELLPPNSEVWIPRAVLEEIMSREGTAKLAVLDETLNPTRADATRRWIDQTAQIAKKLGIKSKLSRADIEVLAVCLQLKSLKPSRNPLLLTDDRWMQNFAIHANISFKNVRFPKATTTKKWVFQCSSCQKQFPEGDQPDCPVCGGSLKPKRIL